MELSNKEALEFATQLGKIEKMSPESIKALLEPGYRELCDPGKKMVWSFYENPILSHFFAHITMGGCEKCIPIVKKCFKDV